MCSVLLSFTDFSVLYVMDLAKEDLLKDLESFSFSEEETDMILSAGRYSIKLKTSSITDIQLTQLVERINKQRVTSIEFKELDPVSSSQSSSSLTTELSRAHARRHSINLQTSLITNFELTQLVLEIN